MLVWVASGILPASPQGPWALATSVPQVIYTIPSSSPVYNVTYVTQTVTVSGLFNPVIRPDIWGLL